MWSVWFVLWSGCKSSHISQKIVFFISLLKNANQSLSLSIYNIYESWPLQACLFCLILYFILFIYVSVIKHIYYCENIKFNFTYTNLYIKKILFTEWALRKTHPIAVQAKNRTLLGRSQLRCSICRFLWQTEWIFRFVNCRVNTSTQHCNSSTRPSDGLLFFFFSKEPASLA